MQLEDMNKAELIKEAKKRKIELPLRAKKVEILKLLSKPVIKQVGEKPELSETPVIKGEQPTAPVVIEPEPSHPVICAGCKMIVDSDTTMPCLNPDCKGSLVFCPMCAKANTCHKCGKKLDPTED